MVSDALLPCPFCGATCTTFNVPTHNAQTGEMVDGGPVGVQCMGCTAVLPAGFDTEAEAVAAWNKRSGGEWVSVEERLPEPGEIALCITSYGVRFVGINEAEGGEVWRYAGLDLESRKVTHWQPLPAPPKESSE